MKLVDRYRNNVTEIKEEMDDKMLQKILKRIDSKPPATQAAFFKSFSEKLMASFMEETPSAKQKMRKILMEVRKSFPEMMDKED